MSSEQVEKGKWHPALASRITGIVFWGLVIVGLALTFFLLRGIEQGVTVKYQEITNRAAYHMTEGIPLDASVGKAQLQQRMESFIHHDGGDVLLGVRLDYGQQSVEVGDTSHSDRDVRRRQLEHHGDGSDQLRAKVTLYFEAMSHVINAERKTLLLTLGGMFMLFGLALQWVLQRVLTDPFIRMVETADKISQGGDEKRFDDQRKDEFGFLAKFINRSLDHLVQQKNELSGALQRVQESESALYKEKVRVEITLHSIGEAVVTTDNNGCIEYLNPMAEQLTGWSLGEVHGTPVEVVINLIDEVSEQPVANLVAQCMQGGEQITTQKGNCSLVRKDGHLVPVSESVSPIRNHEGAVVGVIMVFQDVTPTRRLARELAYQASHDALTGLYNRTEFEDRVSTALENAQSGEGVHALCYIDLDQFKVVNDTCGHMAGDELLRQLSRLLSRQMRENDVIARLGGDELGVLLMYTEPEVAMEVAERLLKAVNDFRFGWDDYGFDVGASIGMVSVTRESLSVAELMSAADVACYAAKDLGRNRIHTYQPDDHEMAQRHGEMQWVSRIKKAMDEDRFCLFYQPIVPTDPDSGLKTHYEALVRLRGEAGELVPPMAFIPAAERYNLMPMIDRWVIENSLEYMRKSHLKCGDYTCAINLSGATLSDDSALDFVIEAIEKSGVPHHQLIFEITETTAISNLGRAELFIAGLHDLGCRFALDDFGSGLSSFGYLKNLKVDFLKIDGSFVRDMVADPVDHAMVEAIHRVGRAMGITTIAEFVESEEIMQALRGIGVDYAQGYHIAKPRSMDDCGEFFAGACSLEKVSLPCRGTAQGS